MLAQRAAATLRGSAGSSGVATVKPPPSENQAKGYPTKQDRDRVKQRKIAAREKRSGDTAQRDFKQGIGGCCE